MLRYSTVVFLCCLFGLSFQHICSLEAANHSAYRANSSKYESGNCESRRVVGTAIYCCMQTLYTCLSLQTVDGKRVPKRDVRRTRLMSSGGDRVWKDEDVKRACARALLLARTLCLQYAVRRAW
jgi:hypothetical protein